jgi:hypothetical protein
LQQCPQKEYPLRLKKNKSRFLSKQNGPEVEARSRNQKPPIAPPGQEWWTRHQEKWREASPQWDGMREDRRFDQRLARMGLTKLSK